MRSAEAAEEARVDATLRLLDAHLQLAPIAAHTADLLFRTASERLLLRQPTDAVGWLVTFHGDTTCTHVGPPLALWRLLTDGGGRLAYVLDLADLWKQGAGDTWLLAEAAERMPK